jgi:hypothetical protein
VNLTISLDDSDEEGILLNHEQNFMPNTNRDDFNQCAALLFRRLYEEFPQELDIAVDDIATVTLSEEMMDNYLATIRFWQREGFIRYQAVEFDVFCRMVLTIKGLKLLDTVAKTKMTFIDKIKVALQTQNDKAIRTIIGEMIKATN